VATLIHGSPLGDLEIPTLLEPVPAGVPFDVDDDIALSLLHQGDLFHLAAPPKVADLRKIATELEIDHTGLKQHELVTAIAQAASAEVLTSVEPAADDKPQEVPA
jgi:hypothetical protein